MIGGVAFVFPGQGSQFIGMGKGFIEADPLFEISASILGYDLVKLCAEGPSERLNSTEYTQPALLAVSLAIFRSIRKQTGIRPAVMAGHSLGEYSALVAAGSVSFNDALMLVKKRGQFMQDAVSEGSGAMSAIIGLDLEIIRSICEESSTDSSVVVPANINSPGQVVISGSRDAVERASIMAKDDGARKVVMLPVSVPSHSPLMIDASERLALEMERIPFRETEIPVISNVSAEPFQDGKDVRKLLREQLYNPVRWVDIIHHIRASGVSMIIEVGPGKVLSGLIRRIDREMKTLTVNSPDDILNLNTSAPSPKP